MLQRESEVDLAWKYRPWLEITFTEGDVLVSENNLNSDGTIPLPPAHVRVVHNRPSFRSPPVATTYMIT